MISLPSCSYDLHQVWVCSLVLRGFIRRASKFKWGLPKIEVVLKGADSSDPSCSLGVAQGGRWQLPLAVGICLQVWALFFRARSASHWLGPWPHVAAAVHSYVYGSSGAGVAWFTKSSNVMLTRVSCFWTNPSAVRSWLTRKHVQQLHAAATVIKRAWREWRVSADPEVRAASDGPGLGTGPARRAGGCRASWVMWAPRQPRGRTAVTGTSHSGNTLKLRQPYTLKAWIL